MSYMKPRGCLTIAASEKQWAQYEQFGKSENGAALMSTSHPLRSDDPLSLNSLETMEIDLPSPRIPMPPEIAKAIIQVMKTIGPVEKRGWNNFHKYRFAAAGDILAEVQPKMAEAGITILPIEVERKFDDAKGMLEVIYEMLVFHESGAQWQERPRQTGYARAKDSKGGWDDKALNKCHTAARKYFILALFNIPTGDIADADADADRADYQSDNNVPHDDGNAPQQERRDPPRRNPTEDKAKAMKDWCDIAKKEIELLPTEKDILNWESKNRETLDRVYERSEDAYRELTDAMTARREQVSKEAANGRKR